MSCSNRRRIARGSRRTRPASSRRGRSSSIHGGGRAIDAELARRGIAPKKVDGLRVTDGPTLDVVVAVLAGTANTELVAALVGHGVRAVGPDGRRRRARPRDAHGPRIERRRARWWISGFVGDPVEADAVADRRCCSSARYVPVIASLGIDERHGDGVLNVNADVMACRIAAALPGSDLVIAGARPACSTRSGARFASSTSTGIDELIASGTATAGMIAKLSACRTALPQGVAQRPHRGRRDASDATHGVDDAPGTTLTAETSERGSPT